MQIAIIPCLIDNYAYIIYDNVSKIVGVVDPSESSPIIAVLKKKSQNFKKGLEYSRNNFLLFREYIFQAAIFLS